MLLDINDSIMMLIDVQEKLVPLIFNKDQLLNRCEWLIKLAHTMHVPLLVTEQYPKGLGPTVAALKSSVSQQDCIEKLYFSCLQEPKLVKRLHECKRNQIIIFGMETHVCVLQSALDMKNAGYDVFVVVDAVGSRKEIDQKYALKRMKQEGVHLITAEMIFFEWLRHSNHPNFKDLSKQFLSS